MLYLHHTYTKNLYAIATEVFRALNSLLWEQKVAGSNPATPTILKPLFLQGFWCLIRLLISFAVGIILTPIMPYLSYKLTPYLHQNGYV